MKVRLKVVSPSGEALMFEHAGPVIHVGRDPECELALLGANSDGVSRKHARIELADGAATLSDLGSLNLTYLNDQPITAPVPLRVGDRVQPGIKGPTLTVVELDLAAAVPVRVWQSWHLAAAGGIAATLLLAVGFLVFRGKADPVQVVQTSTSLPTDPNGRPNQGPSPPPSDPSDQKPPKTTPPKSVPKDAKEPSPAKPRTDDPVLPSARIAEVGQYLPASEKMPLSVLLQRLNEKYVWTLLRAGDAVSSGHHLIALPGYQSTLLLHPKYQGGQKLDEGIALSLVGYLPEVEGQFPPIAESAVTLHYPEDAKRNLTHDADFTLERGRVLFGNAKKAAAARIRIRFLDQVWDVTLDPNTKAAAELWYLPEDGFHFWLFTDGSAQLQPLGKAAMTLRAKAQAGWQSKSAGRGAAPEVHEGLPAWWERKVDLKVDPKSLREPNSKLDEKEMAALLAQDALGCLKDWQAWLAEGSDVTEYIADRVLDKNAKGVDSSHRAHGMRFLAVLDMVNKLLQVLDRNDVEERVWGGAVFAIRRWLMQDPGRIDSLKQMVSYEFKNKPTADAIVQLLEGINSKNLKSSTTQRQLIEWLNHDRFVVRKLAFGYVELILGEPAKKSGYTPAEPERTKRSADIEKLRSLLDR